ncbi:MAG: Ig-like domain-containing protein, partial [Lachnospiraceae bacterium]|nr:Ig-like domain-containing protein [Lachnospiraceae bacterium]
VQYRIDITDARGSLVDSFRWDANNYTSHDGKKKTFTQAAKYQNDKIVRLSKYNVSVTTLCGDEASTKPVKKTVKTTDFPAAYYALAKTGYGGTPIRVYGKAGGTTQFNAELKDRKYLTSGNAYTLSAQVTTPAQYRMTDTLTWKSSDTKVAAVKAKAGTYTAQLNALKPGSAVIEVTSKITKKVIARWVVFVKAVGNAETYYGDYEFTYEYPFAIDPYYAAKVEVMTLQNDVHVTPSEVENASYDYRWVKFTAPAKGTYTFERSDCKPSALVEVISSMERQIPVSEINRGYGIWMTEGEVLYFKLCGSFTMRVSEYVKLGKSFTIDDGSVSINSDIKQIVEFRSLEDNVYTFYSKEFPGLAGRLTVYDAKMSSYDSSKYRIWTDDEGLQKIDISLKNKEIIYFEVPTGKYTIYAEKRTPETLTDDGAALALTDKVKEKWYVYTAEQEGLYTFRSKDATTTLTAEYFVNLTDLDANAWGVTNDGSNFTGKMTLKAGQNVFLKINADEAATATVSVAREIPVRLSIGEEKALSVQTGDRKWVAFTVSEPGRYQFRAAAAESGADYQVKLRYFKNAIEENEFTLIDEDEIIVSDQANNKPDAAVGDTIYVEVTTDKEGGDAANVKVSLTQVCAIGLKIGEPVSITVKNGDVHWFTYTVPKDTRYVVQSIITENTTADTHKLTAERYAGGLEQRNKTNTLGTIGAYDFSKEMTYSAEKSEAIRVSANDLGLGENGGEITTTAVIVLKEAVEPLAINDTQTFPLRTGERRWFSFTVPEAGRYQFRAVPTESSADYHVNLKYYKNAIEANEFTPIDENEMIVSNVTYYNPDAAVGDTIYVEITTDKEGTDAANVKVSLTQVHAVELKMGEPVTITVKNGDVLWYRFAVPGEKKYVVVQSAVTENVGADNTVTDTHKLTADLYVNGLEQRNKTNTLDTIGAYDFFKEFSYSKEKLVTVRVSANDLGLGEDGGEITTTAVIVLKEAVEPIEMEDPQALTLRTGERRWFSFTAPQTDTYIFRSDLTEGKFDLSYKTSMESSTWYTLDNVRAALDLEKGETIYLDLESTGTPAKLTFSVEFPDKLLGTAEKTVTVTSKTPAYFMYVTGSDELARYVVTYTKDVQDAAVSLLYDNTRANPSNNSVTQGYVERDMEDRCFFKVSTTSETPVAVTVKIAQIEPIKLNVGDTDNIPVAARGESGARRNTWCSFTAPETGRYAIDKTTSDSSNLSYYKKMTGNPNPDWQNYYYEKGETIYIALYTTSENAQSTSVKINKIETTQIEGVPVSVDDQILPQGILNTKGYLYTVPKTGLYTFTNQDTARVQIKLYMDPSDSIGETVTGSSPRPLFLKENDVIYINVMPTKAIANVKFTIEYAGEAQTLSAGENTITFGEQGSHLSAFTAPDAGLYHFDVAYTGDSSVGATGSAYLMKDSQAIGGTNSSLYSEMSGDAGSIAFANRLVGQGETVYLSIPKPSSATGAVITVSKAEETVETVIITEETELERVFEDGDKVYYIFDVPEDGTYNLMAESRVDTGYCYYKIYYNKYGLSDLNALNTSSVWLNVGTTNERTLGSLNKHQRICFRVDKTTNTGDSVSKFSITIKKQS